MEVAQLEIENIDEHGNKIPLGKVKFSYVKPRFMVTSFNICSQRTHFMKSWDKPGKYSLVDVMSWSALSATYYFEEVNVDDYEWCHYQPDDYEQCRYEQDPKAVDLGKKRGAVFQDAGQGTHNNALIHVLMEILASNWTVDENVYILSLGAGNIGQYLSYHKATRFNKRKRFFSSVLAREYSIVDQVLATIFVSRNNPKIQFKRIDTMVKEEEYGVDKIEYIEQYKQYGIELSIQITDEDIKLLQSR